MNKKYERHPDEIKTSQKRGHPYFYDGEEIEYYLDTAESTSEERPCIKCGEMPTKEGNDACLGRLPGVNAACCGHGVDEGYIYFKNGVIIRAYFTIEREWIVRSSKLLNQYQIQSYSDIGME